MNQRTASPQRAIKRALTVCKVGGPMAQAPIEMWVHDSEVGIRMALDDFLSALSSEVGNPALMVTSGQLETRLRAAADRVVTSMKNQTVGLA